MKDGLGDKDVPVGFGAYVEAVTESFLSGFLLGEIFTPSPIHKSRSFLIAEELVRILRLHPRIDQYGGLEHTVKVLMGKTSGVNVRRRVKTSEYRPKKSGIRGAGRFRVIGEDEELKISKCFMRGDALGERRVLGEGCSREDQTPSAEYTCMGDTLRELAVELSSEIVSSFTDTKKNALTSLIQSRTGIIQGVHG